jgi:RluA family pseudouridine synthase
VPAPVPILYEDDSLVVVDKPPGLLSVPELGERLVQQGLRAVPVHRLDRDVSGTLVLARDERTRAVLELAFRERRVGKVYWALASGHLRRPEGDLRYPILEERGRARVSSAGKPSLTRYRTLAAHEHATEVEVELVTGRMNQIRVHFAHAGNPLVGERKYARGKDSAVRAPSRRVALHAWRVELVHPHTGAPLVVEAPLPADLEALRARA